MQKPNASNGRNIRSQKFIGTSQILKDFKQLDSYRATDYVVEILIVNMVCYQCCHMICGHQHIGA